MRTPELNRFVERITSAHPPASPGRRHVRVLYAAQTGTAPPTFVFFTNVATTFHFSYERFLVNQLRDSFGFFGSPIRLDVRARDRRLSPRRLSPHCHRSRVRRPSQFARMYELRGRRRSAARRKGGGERNASNAFG